MTTAAVNRIADFIVNLLSCVLFIITRISLYLLNVISSARNATFLMPYSALFAVAAEPFNRYYSPGVDWEIADGP